jgi:Double-GTPase 2
MPWLIFLAGVVWLVLCWLCLAFVTVPLTLFAISAGLLCGAALAINGYRRIYTGTEDKRVLARPDAEAPRWRRAPYPRWDGGWPSYLSWQAERDFLAAFAWPRRQADRFWAKGMEWASPYVLPLMGALPLLPVPVGFLVGVTAGAYGGWAVLAAAVEIIMAIPRCLRLSAIWVLRGVDSSVRWWRGAAPTCPRCRYVTWLPAYLCRGPGPCKVIHRDLRPGRLGVWQRRCKCTEHLPTTVLRATGILTPICPNCSNPLYKQAGVVPDARIALSGGPRAGKTQLLMQAMTEMTSPTASWQWKPADDYTIKWLRYAQKIVKQLPGDGPETTTESGLLTFCRTRCEQEQRYFHVADVDGRHFETSKDNTALWQLGTTRRHLLVLDPTSFPSIRDQIGSGASNDSGSDGKRSDLAWSETSMATVELPYRLLVAQLSRLGARSRRCSLALVVTKADILAAHHLAPELGADGSSASGLREWLRDVELHKIVDAAEHDFAEVRYFLIGEGQQDPAAAFEWLLSQYLHGAGVPR